MEYRFHYGFAGKTDEKGGEMISPDQAMPRDVLYMAVSQFRKS